MVTVLLAAVTLGRVIYLSPQGNDTSNGTRSAPMRSLTAAVDALRGVAQARIVLLAGEYFLTQTVRVAKESECLTIEGTGRGATTLIGGVRVINWARQGDLFVAPVTDEVARDGARMLMVSGKLRPRSRVPATGEFEHESVFDVPWMSTTGGGWKRKPTDLELTTMRFKPGDIGDWLDPASAEITVFHMWDESCVGVGSIDVDRHELRFSSPTGHPPGAFGVKKYVVWNTLKGLTEPGQWFLDRRAKRVYYRPMPGESPTNINAYLPRTNVLIEAKDASNLTLRNLRIRVGNVSLKAGGFGAGDYEGAVTAVSCPKLTCEQLNIGEVAGNGMKLWNCTDSVVSRCDVSDTGACGIRSEGDRSLVTDCTIRFAGCQYPSAIGLWVSGKDAVTVHNSVTDTSYSAIIGAGPGQLIADNYVARAMLKLHDGAGIYFGGTDHVTVRHNLLESIVDTGGYGASAYYLDEQARDCTVEDNVSIEIVRPSQNHMATRNTIKDNLFVESGDMRMDFARCKDYRITGNVIDCGGTLLMRVPPNGVTTISDNVLGAPSGVKWSTLTDYADTTSHMLTGAENQFHRAGIKQLRRRVWQAAIPGGPIRTWDMSEVGPRGATR